MADPAASSSLPARDATTHNKGRGPPPKAPVKHNSRHVRTVWDQFDPAPRSREDLVAFAARLQQAALGRVQASGVPPVLGITALSFFDGLGGLGLACKLAGIPVSRYVAVENNPTAVEVCKHANPPTTAFAGVDHGWLSDIEHVTEAAVVALGPIHLVAGGPPCQDFSKARLLRDFAGRLPPTDPRLGLEGRTGRLFRIFIRVVGWVRKHNPDCTFLCECSDFGTPPGDMPKDYAEVCASLGTPTPLNATRFSYTNRNRAYWHNMHLAPGWDDSPPMGDPDLMMDAGRTLQRKYRADGSACPLPTITATWSEEPHPAQKTAAAVRVHDAVAGLCYLRPDEAERLLGMPAGCTAAPGVSAAQRLTCIGNGWDIRTVARLLSNFRAVPVPPGERGMLQAVPWKATAASDAGKAPLPVVQIAAWLSEGPCPDPVAGSLLPAWDESVSHPKASYLLSEWAHGADIRYDGDRSRTHLCENNPSWWTWPEESKAIMEKNIASGTLVGPFVCPPDGFLQTPMALVEEPDKYRPITNAKMGAEINADIPDPLDPSSLVTHRRLQQYLGRCAARRQQGLAGMWMAKRDIRQAYRNVPVRPEDWKVAGLKVDGKFFLDTALNFGTRSSPDKFLELSDAVEWVMQRWGVHCFHYIDDFIFVGDSEAEVAEQIARFEAVCKAFGLPIKQEKDVGPAQCITVLGVQYDLRAGAVRMPERQTSRIRAACVGMLAKQPTPGEVDTLVGVMVWAGQCMPAAAPFVTRLRAAAIRARGSKVRTMRISQAVRQDLAWWVQALDSGMAKDGAAIIPVVRQATVIAKGDAGSEWGLGAHDGAHYYSVATPPEVTRAATRKTTTSSTFLELYQMLVLARVMGPTWTGQHVAMQVDNYALVPAFRKGRGNTEQESDMVREIALLQVTQGWSWEVSWIPRALNEAADALSKNDMPRFWANVEGTRAQLTVSPAQLRLPRPGGPCGRGVLHRGRSTAPRALLGSGRERPPGGDPHRPHRAVLLPSPQGAGAPLWGQLTQQVHYVQAQLPQRAHTTGVSAFLKMGVRAGQPMSALFPADLDAMSLNLQRFMVDGVLSYPYIDASTGRHCTKTAVQAATSKRYMHEVALYYDELTGAQHKLHLGPVVKAFTTHLLKSLPGQNCQKTGLTAATMRDVVTAIRSVYGIGSVQEAAMTVSWVALLRPGECVVTPRYSQWDISRHLAPRDVRFYQGESRRYPGDGQGVPPRMEFVIKDSKTDHLRLTSTVVVGRTDDPSLCAVAAMWSYMEANKALPAAAPLLQWNGKPYAYARLVGDLRAALLRSGMAPAEVASYAGHSFRIGGAQALALAGYSLPYIMAMGRWKCVESVLTYVKTPTMLRVRDAGAMIAAPAQLTLDQARRRQAQVAQAQAVSAASSHLRAHLMPEAPQ